MIPRLRFNLVALLILVSFGASAQFVVSNAAPHNNPASLVQNVLLGPTVPFIPSWPPPANSVQIGRFTGGISAGIGIDTGIVLISGNATDALPGQPNSTGFTATPDVDLANMLNAIGSGGFSINDKAVIEFDFVATGDSLSFEYVFASYEYTGFTCSAYNDPFGFFLTGMGINGVTGTSTVNLASVPNTNPPIPVAVNTLNSGVPSGGSPAACLAANPNFVASAQYFIANPTGINATGHTTVLRARASVVCGNIYHMKMAVADVADGALHSMAFIKARSFQTPSIQLTTRTNAGSSFADSLSVEGCAPTYLKARKAGNVNDLLVIHFTKSGTAIQGVDYAPFPDSLVVAPGVVEDSIPIFFYDDGMPEPVETLILTTPVISTPCFTFPSQVIEFNIRDRTEVVPEITLLSGSDTVDCSGSPISIQGSWTGGDGLTGGEWETGSANMLRWDTIFGNTTYYLYAWDECSADSVVDSLSIYLRDAPPILTEGDSLFTCYAGDSLSLNPVYSGGSGGLNFAWEDGNQDNPRGIEVRASGYHRYTVADVCGLSATDSIYVFLPPPVVAAFGWLEDFNVQLGVRMSNFSQNAIDYFWDFGDGDTSTAISPKHRYSKPGIYTVRLYAVDQYGCSDFTQIAIEVKQEFNLYIPDAFSPNGDNINETFQIQGGGIKEYSIRIFNRWGEEVYFSEDIERAWDGTFKGESVPSGVYYFTVNLKLPDNKLHQEQGSLILFR